MREGSLFPDDPSNPLVAAFEKFHAENPKVYELFSKFALQAIAAGRTRFGARMIWNRIRWYTAVETSDPDFKLNDHHSPYYARMFMRDHPRYEGFFETRRTQDES
jgi:hypothetical protein